MRNIDSIIVHCSATKAGQDFTATDIDRWHRERGFNGIGYHYVIRLDGKLEKGRDVALAGAHCKGWSGYVISADWMRTGVRQIPGRMLKNGYFIRLLSICSGNIIFSKCWDIGILHRI